MKTIKLNYIYFGILFAILLALTILNLLSIKQINSSRFFFLVYSLGQIFFEIFFMIISVFLAKKYLSKMLCAIYIGFSFVFFLTHIFDFFLNRILDLNLLQTLDFVLDESYTNLVEMLHASGIPLFVWIMGVSAIFITPFLGYLFFVFCEKISNKAPIEVQKDKIYQALACIPFALVIWDISASRIINVNDYTIYTKLLPWNRTFFQPKSILIATKGCPKKPPTEASIINKLQSKNYKALQRPNIYLFIAESLRDDYINSSTAPTLHAFKQSNIHFPISLSNANATFKSWFSIFHSRFSHQWLQVKKSNWTIGSPPLYFLKKMGYQIHVYTSAALAYYGMEELIFGQGHSVTDSFDAFLHYHPIQAYESDAKTIGAFKKFISKNKEKEGHVHIFFLDATHFDYSYPEKTFTKFEPISASLTFFKAYPKLKDLEKIKNRYRNSIYYLDFLFKDFISTLKESNLYDSSVIVFTGDHGEEFMERGHMFHCSELNKEQTTVPIYYKFGNNNLRSVNQSIMTCHMEIFPSIFDYLFGENLFSDVLDGNSIFDVKKWPFVMTSRYNASRAPYEFFIHNGKLKLIAQFKNKKDIFASKEIKVVSIKDTDENYIYYTPQKIQYFIEKEFGPAIDQIFYSN